MKKLRHVSSERNLRTERLIFCQSLTYRDGDLPPDQQTSTKNVSPSPRQWTSCLDSAWTCPSLHSLPINRLPRTEPSMDVLGTCYSMDFSNCISSASPNKLNFWSFELAFVYFLPRSTSITSNIKVKVTFVQKSIWITGRKWLYSFSPQINYVVKSALTHKR